jgi:hypothetical protein
MRRTREGGAFMTTLTRLSASQVALSGLEVPHHSGGCGRCTGSSSIGTSSKRKKAPRWVKLREVSAFSTMALTST